MGFNMLILMMVAGSLFTYIISRINYKVGAISTVVFSLISLIVILLSKSQIGESFSILYMNFNITTIGWYFSAVMVLVYAMSSFFNIYWMEQMLYLSLIHISEPTRLGMISYAVFCLKKKNKK